MNNVLSSGYSNYKFIEDGTYDIIVNDFKLKTDLNDKDVAVRVSLIFTKELESITDTYHSSFFVQDRVVSKSNIPGLATVVSYTPRKVVMPPTKSSTKIEAILKNAYGQLTVLNGSAGTLRIKKETIDEIVNYNLPLQFILHDEDDDKYDLGNLKIEPINTDEYEKGYLECGKEISQNLNLQDPLFSKNSVKISSTHSDGKLKKINSWIFGKFFKHN